jgi:hypothetical protein
MNDKHILSFTASPKLVAEIEKFRKEGGYLMGCKEIGKEKM